LSLSMTELNLTGRMGRENVLRKALSSVATAYDVCLIDCPPSLGLLTINALTASAAVICPTVPTAVDLRGLLMFVQSLEMVRGELNPGIELLGVVVTQYNRRLSLHQAAMDDLQAGGMPVLGVISGSVDVARRVGDGRPAAGIQAEQYNAIAAEVDKWLRNH
ncbi:MAG: ParA family protein, partial [Chloroflexota bacterium]